MHTLDQQRDQTPQAMTADSAAAYAEEVRALRQRVALLEAELAATKATHIVEQPERPAPPMTSIDFAPATEAAPSQFCESATPAVQPAAAVNEPDEGFAQAWTAETEASSFEERIAEKAFFRASTVDEESRSWLLDQ